MDLTYHIKRAVQKGVGHFFFFFKDQTSNLPNIPQFLICLLLNAAEVTQLQIGVLYTIYIPGHQAHMNPVCNVSSIPTLLPNPFLFSFPRKPHLLHSENRSHHT